METFVVRVLPVRAGEQLCGVLMHMASRTERPFASLDELTRLLRHHTTAPDTDDPVPPVPDKEIP